MVKVKALEELTTREEFISEIINAARMLLGKTYVRGARPRWPHEFIQNGVIIDVDCSSLITFAFWEGARIEFVPCTLDIAKSENGICLYPPQELFPGDLVFFEGEKGHYDHGVFPGLYLGHVGLISYDGGIIHAVNSGGKSGVVEHEFIDKEHLDYTPRSIVLIKRFFKP